VSTDGDRPTSPQSPNALMGGLSIWIPRRDASRLSVLAADDKVSHAEMLHRLIEKAFRARVT
jgi:hypothetical protein